MAFVDEYDADTLEFLAAASQLLAAAEKKGSKIAKKKAIRRMEKKEPLNEENEESNNLDAALNDNEVVLCKFNIVVTRKDMRRLCPGRMLNDNLINIYLERLLIGQKQDAVLLS
uniref:Uncharacterized protein n=1 Tax=Ditylenchus dipsaci TaxID=166011 RepID=A0A915EEG6_9BILA